MRASGVVIDRRIYGHLTGRTVGLFVAAGWRVHRVGAAAYIHDPTGEQRWIFGVWPRAAVEPAWAPDLDAYHRCARGRGSLPRRWWGREDAAAARRLRAQRAARIHDRSSGRFIGSPAWWQLPDGTPIEGYGQPSARIS